MDRREALKRVALLFGGTLTVPQLVAALDAYRPLPPGAVLTPRVLGADHHELVAVIAEHILPQTDTPGARAAGVPDFIERLLAEWFHEEERNHFLAGLANVDARARQAYGKAFLEATPDEQRAVLLRLDQRAFAGVPPLVAQDPGDIREQIEGPGEDPLEAPVDEDAGGIEDPESQDTEAGRVPFFRTMKELTLVGYYLSEIGATQELRYEPIPGRFNGCVPFEEIGRTWAV